jgi:hypothetical protein
MLRHGPAVYRLILRSQIFVSTARNTRLCQGLGLREEFPLSVFGSRQPLLNLDPTAS